MGMKAEEVYAALNQKIKGGGQFNPEEYYNKNQIDEKLRNTFKVKGSIYFSEFPSASDVSAGWVYNIKDDFTTTADFLEGAGFSYPKGTNVAMTDSGKWDCLAGTYDFSEFAMKNDLSDVATSGSYNDLDNKPSINNKTLEGAISLSDIGIQPMTADEIKAICTID